MIASVGSKVTRAVTRNFSTSLVRTGGHGHGPEGLWPKAGSVSIARRLCVKFVLLVLIIITHLSSTVTVVHTNPRTDSI